LLQRILEAKKNVLEVVAGDMDDQGSVLEGYFECPQKNGKRWAD
jgi:hypothetical protein